MSSHPEANLFKDKNLVCRECSREFIFTSGEQEFYAEKGFENEPARCPECRSARKQQLRNNRGPREMFDVICSSCGAETQVPFKPSQDRPVYCKDCFENQR